MVCQVDLAGAPGPARRLFGDVDRLLDQLQPAHLVAVEQTALVQPSGTMTIRLVHADDHGADLDINAGDRTASIDGLGGFDDLDAAAGESEDKWRADAIETLAGLLQGRYRIETITWRDRPYRTRVIDIHGSARHCTHLRWRLGWLPIPPLSLVTTTRELDYGCRGGLASRRD